MDWWSESPTEGGVLYSILNMVAEPRLTAAKGPRDFGSTSHWGEEAVGGKASVHTVQAGAGQCVEGAAVGEGEGEVPKGRKAKRVELKGRGCKCNKTPFTEPRKK